MKCIYAFLISFFAITICFGQTITKSIIPLYITAGGSEKTPFACQLTISGLSKKATYKYYNRLVFDADLVSGSTSNGAGNLILVNPATGAFTRVTAPLFTLAGRYLEFTTDDNGEYTGWFIYETSSFGSFPSGLGTKTYARVMLNDGAGGTAVVTRVTAANDPINILSFGTASGDGTALRSTAASFGTAKNFVMVYDNAAGTGRPVAGTVMENDGVDNNASAGYAPFYTSDVNTVNKAWGTMIPNNLAGGVQKIVQYGLTDGARVGSTTNTNGIWPGPGGTTVNTINTSTGTGTVLVIDGNAAPLSPPASQSITFNLPGTKTYGDADFNPGAIASSGLPVTYTSSDPAIATVINGNTIHIAGVGTVDITAVQAGDDNFAKATDKKTMTVDKANLIIKANDLHWVQGTPMPALTVSYITFVNGDDENDLSPLPTVTTTATPTSGVGSYPITASGASSPNYNITYQSGTLTVGSNKLSQTITFVPITGKLYGAADFNAGAVVSSNLSVTYTSSDTNIVRIEPNNKVHIKKAGTVTLTASQLGDQNYDPAQDVSQVLTIGKAPLTITAENKKRYLNQPNPVFTVRYAGFVNNEDESYLIVKPVATSTGSTTAGTYPITASGAVSDNYSFIYVDGVLTIDPALAQTITFAPFSTIKKYGDPSFVAEAKASSNLPVTFTSADANVAKIINGNEIQIVGAGTVEITASQAGDAVYAPATDVKQILTIIKATLTIRADNYMRNEGEANPKFTITYSGFINGDDSTKLTALPTISTVATPASVAGTYRINVVGAVSNSYFLNMQNGILTVLPAQGEEQDNVYAYMSAPGQLQLNIFVVNQAKVTNQLFDLNGSRLVNTTTTLAKGFNSYRIPVGNLAPGIYNVRVGGNGVMLKTKVVIR